MKHHRYFRFLKLLSSSVLSQALLSAANFGVGIILIRRATDLQYGYYVLAFNTTLLLISLHHAFFYPPMVNRLNELEKEGRIDLIGGLLREQGRLLLPVGLTALAVSLGLWYMGTLDSLTGPLVVLTVITSVALLHREFFRMALMAHRQPFAVLRTDLIYVVLLVSGALLATTADSPAPLTIVAMGLGAVVSAIFLARSLWRHEPWDRQGMPGILRQIAPLASWSASGAGVHWLFSQGYTYIAAAILSVEAVAVIVATRLLLMPVNLLSMGIGTLMLPIASRWLNEHGAALVWRRLMLFTLGVATLALIYCGLLWFMRDWVFAVVLDKEFENSDQLLMLWCAIFLMMVVRDQLVSLLAARSRFPYLTSLAFVSALVALTVSYFAMQRYGVVGAPLGVLVGETINVAGIIVRSVLEKNADSQERGRTGMEARPAEQ